jgi:hypothetical protein
MGCMMIDLSGSMEGAYQTSLTIPVSPDHYRDSRATLIGNTPTRTNVSRTVKISVTVSLVVWTIYQDDTLGWSD